MMRYLIPIILSVTFGHFSYAEEPVELILREVQGLPENFKVYTSREKEEKINFSIKDTQRNKVTNISLDSVVFKLEQMTFITIGKAQKPFLVVEWLKAPHGGWAFIYDLKNLEKGHLDVIKSYYPFDEIKGDKEENQIYLFGTSFMSMEKKDPVIKFTWKEK